MKSISLFLFVAAFVISTDAYSSAQVSVVRKYLSEDGLVSNYIQSLFRDSRGFLWVGTRRGLQRFDGIVFRTYYTGANITNIAEDKNGNLVFAATDGRVNQVLFKGTQSVVQCLDSSFQGRDHVKALCCDSSGNTWVLSSLLGLRVYKNGTVRKMVSADEVNRRGLSSLCSSSQGLLVGAMDKSLNRLDLVSERFGILAKTSESIVAMVCQGEYVWLSCENGVQRFHLSSGKLESVSLNAPGTAKTRWSTSVVLKLDGNGRVYLNSNQGLISMGREQNHFQGILFRQPGSLVTGNIWATALVFQEQDIAWVGTENGLLKCTFGNSDVRNYNLNDYTGEKFPLKLRSIVEIGKDTFLTGSANNNGIYRVILKEKGLEAERYYYPSEFPVNTVNVIKKDKEGNVWLGTNSALLRYTPGKTMASYPKASFVWDILPDEKGGLWCAARDNGITYFHPGSLVEKRYLLKSDNGLERVWQLLPYQHYLLLASTGGFHYFNTHSMQYDTGLPNLDKLLPRLKGKLWHMEWLNDHLLAISSEFDGIIFLDMQTNELRTFPFEKRNFYGFLKDAANNLWIVSDIGLVFFDTHKKTFRVLRQEQGLSNHDFSYKGMFRRENGEMIFCGDHGFSLFSPEKINFDPPEEHIFITSLAVSGNEYSDFLEKPASLEFSYNENNLSFRFADLGLQRTSNGRFRYWLQGLDNSWSNLENINYVVYRNLPPGAYAFYAVGEENDPDKMNALPLLTFRITPPVWKRVPFIVGMVLLGVGSISLLLLLRFRAIQRHHHHEKSRLESEIKALRAQINPHFIFNALSSIQYFILHNQGREANQYLARFSLLMRQILDYSSKQTIFLEDEILLLENYLEMEKMRFEDQLTWSISLSPEISGREKIPTLLLQPLVENAVVHGIGSRKDGGSVALHFSRKDNCICCTIRDNGVGMQQTGARMGHDSKGIIMLRERLAYINQKYRSAATLSFSTCCDSVTFPGTEVYIQLPVLNAEDE